MVRKSGKGGESGCELCEPQPGLDRGQDSREATFNGKTRAE